MSPCEPPSTWGDRPFFLSLMSCMSSLSRCLTPHPQAACPLSLSLSLFFCPGLGPISTWAWSSLQLALVARGSTDSWQRAFLLALG